MREKVARGEAAAWRAWMKELGALVRRMRELLSLSQGQLAEIAHVSQGAVSRFELGLGLSTPWTVAVKIRVALAARLRQMDPAVLTDDARHFLEQTALYNLPDDPSMPPEVATISLLPAPELESILRTYSRLSKEGQKAFVSIMAAVADTLVKTHR
jgi:transcriptional regulator with XRE-family HTH domain